MSDQSDDDAVGYGKPPKSTRFKKGQSGNPRGRPKGKTLDKDATVYERFMTTVFTVNEKGRRVKRTLRELVMQTFMKKLLAGDPRMLKMWLELEVKYGSLRVVDDADTKGGVLVVSRSMTLAEWEKTYSGVRPQPTIPILEEIRKELGMPPTNAGLNKTTNGDGKT